MTRPVWHLGHIDLYTQTDHGTAIYAYLAVLGVNIGIYGCPMECLGIYIYVDFHECRNHVFLPGASISIVVSAGTFIGWS